MSIELKVFPTVLNTVTWGDIKKKLYALINSQEKELLGEKLSLIESGSERKIEDDECLSLDSRYYLLLAIPNTLGLSVMSKAQDIDEDSLELDYLEDYGDNIEPKDVQILSERLQIARHFYILSSFGGRSRPEPRLFVAIATAIAYSCNGYIVVTSNDLFNLAVGVYESEEFQHAKPKF
jgi:hypothetical protein